MQKTDNLLRLMKQRTDALVASDEKLQQFLMWVNQKSLSVKVTYKPAAVRAFYLDCDCARSRALELALDLTLVFALERDLELALVLDRALDRALDRGLGPIHALDRALNRTFEPELRQALQELKEQLPNRDCNKDRLKKWWQANAQAWTKQLRAVMIKHRNIGHEWQFSEQQKELLKQYYDANLLLVDCLKSSGNVTPAVRSHIEETLLLPIASIEKTGSYQDK